jgi:hypothetical protein
MPPIVQGFEGSNRTHRIASPTDPNILASGMPNACNLCHLDKSLAWTRDQLEEGWGRRIELPSRLQAHYGEGFRRPMGEAWLTHPFLLSRLVAANAYASSPLGKETLPLFLQYLAEPNAYLRFGYFQAVEKILGRRLVDEEYSVTGSRKVRQKQIQKLIERFTRNLLRPDKG